MDVKITTLGHACFMLEAEGYRAVIDPYMGGMIPGLPELRVVADAVWCSHGHGDHNAKEAVGLFAAEKQPPYTLTEFVTPHDDQGGKLRGMNTVRIFDFGGTRVAHLGDIGCFPDEELAAALKGVDCMLIPVGGFYTVNAQTAYQIVRAAEPRVCIPMHYSTEDTGFDNIAKVEDFTKLFAKVNTMDNTFVLTSETEKQTLVLNYKP